MEEVTIDGVRIRLAHPDKVDWEWVGQREVLRQILASWLVLTPDDRPLNPRLIGPPGVGKTTLACAGAEESRREVYLFQATADTRPEDLIIAPVLGEGGSIRYVASPIVSAMIRGGVAVLDEGNRMSEKAWASLAALLDQRRYVESIIAGIKIEAHEDFRFCTTMNDDASTFDLPEYIASRLLPKIVVDFPDAEEELRILASNLPFAPQKVLHFVIGILQRAHAVQASYSVRDGINLTRFALKRAQQRDGSVDNVIDFLPEAVESVLGEEALDLLPEEGTAPGPYDEDSP